MATNKPMVSIANTWTTGNDESKPSNSGKDTISAANALNVIRIDQKTFAKWNTTNNTARPANKYHGDLKIIIEMTSILMRWDKIPPNGTLFLPNPVNTKYRVVIAFTADFPSDQVLIYIK